jgi:tetratricopeptide (TPR) repeat protein
MVCLVKAREIRADSLELCVLHERILLLPTASDHRRRLLNMLGDIWWKAWKESHAMNNLNQAISAYEDAVRDDPANSTYLKNLGLALVSSGKHYFPNFPGISP